MAIAHLEFEIGPADVGRLLRAPALMARREGRIRTTSVRRVWHDTAQAELAASGLCLCELDGGWRLEASRPGARGGAPWHPATQPPLVVEALDPGSLPDGLPANLVPAAAFSGHQRVVTLAGAATLTILDGTLRGVTDDRPAARLLLDGPVPDMVALALELAGTAPLGVPHASLAAAAMAVATGTRPSPRHTGTPRVPPGATVDEAIAQVTGHLVDVILHWGRMLPNAEGAGSAEPVHQMRVAVRRLRSACAVFHRAAGSTLDEATLELRKLAAALGPARDWDVFLEGTGADIGRAFPDDRRIASLLAAAERRQREAYAALAATLASPWFRQLALTLALLPTRRPWADDPGLAEKLGEPVRTAAVRTLDRRLKHMTVSGGRLMALTPEGRHDVRKQAKRLRYAAEFFTPLFADKPARRFLRRLERVQEALGTLNDAAVAHDLMEQLSGRERGFASGVVQGFVAALGASAGADAERAWAKLRRQAVFWR